MGPPLCPHCPWGLKCSELVTPSMREKWARGKGTKWSWGRDGCAWFSLCQRCHLSEHPCDFRTNNGSSRPGDDGRRYVSDRAVLTSGCVFWFMREVPETTLKIFNGEKLGKRSRSPRRKPPKTGALASSPPARPPAASASSSSARPPAASASSSPAPAASASSSLAAAPVQGCLRGRGARSGPGVSWAGGGRFQRMGQNRLATARKTASKA